ncbi:hypothetical protein MUK42_35047 [Musa troglodytarum]|uniref:Uncharacterized protein n=1 Tax=Musa troglodytarum TaxID=320322 RepID=A0A9E7KY45_9LILI|nr:hypothetical protein MUK42_35047 [Musa troglodytarum]
MLQLLLLHFHPG